MAVIVLIFYNFAIYLCIKHSIRDLLALVGRLLFKSVLTFGLAFSWLINCFFFTSMLVFLDIPYYILSSKAAGNEWIEDGECRMRGVKAQEGLEGWCRIKLCPTDDISEFELDISEGVWEDRVSMKVSKEQLERGIKEWVAGISEEEDAGSAIFDHGNDAMSKLPLEFMSF